MEIELEKPCCGQIHVKSGCILFRHICLRRRNTITANADKVVEMENEVTVVCIDFVAQYGYNIIRILLLCIGYTGAGGAFMNIRPSAAIRQNYNEIADLCRETAEPIFLTKNGEGDLVVMDIETYNRREKMLKLREELLSVEEDRLRGSEGYSIDEVASMMRSAIKEAAGHGTAK